MDASSAVVAHTKVFVVARNKHVVPKTTRIERLARGTLSKSLKTIPKAATVRGHASSHCGSIDADPCGTPQDRRVKLRTGALPSRRTIPHPRFQHSATRDKILQIPLRGSLWSGLRQRYPRWNRCCGRTDVLGSPASRSLPRRAHEFAVRAIERDLLSELDSHRQRSIS